MQLSGDLPAQTDIHFKIWESLVEYQSSSSRSSSSSSMSEYILSFKCLSCCFYVCASEPSVCVCVCVCVCEHVWMNTWIKSVGGAAHKSTLLYMSSRSVLRPEWVLRNHTYAKIYGAIARGTRWRLSSHSPLTILKTLRASLVNATHYFLPAVEDGISVTITLSRVEHFELSSPNNMALKALRTAFTARPSPLEASPLLATLVSISSPLSAF